MSNEFVARKGLLVPSGNVGIGTTSPATKLTVLDGSLSDTRQLRLGFSDLYYWEIGRNDTKGGLDFVVKENNTPSSKMFITYTGNVGIGTTSPATILSVQGANATNMITWTDAINNTGYLGIRTGGVVWMNADNNLVFATAATERMRITSTGNVGIGTTSPSYQLQLSTDSAAKPSTNTWTIASDSRVKENINPYTKGLDVIMSINPVTYDYNGKAGFEKIKNNVGVIAQEIKDVLPEGISTYLAKLNEDDIENTELYNFNSHALTYVLINAIKELKNELETLKNK